MTELRLLGIVRRVCTLCGAARELGVSQPAISRRVKLLEKKCDIELFDRGMYTTYLTPEGERVADQARRVLEEYERLVRLLAAIRRQARL